MSKVSTVWDKLDENGFGSPRDYFEDKYGPWFSNGCNIGREVRAKIESLSKNVTLWESGIIWPTLLQADGRDNGLSAGFLTGMGIHVVGDETRDDIIETGRKAIREHGADASVSILETVLDIPEEYMGEYGKYHIEQGWLYPALFIEYVPLTTPVSEA